MSIVINTPTSHIGRALATRLLDAGEPVTVLSRDKKKVDELHRRGARVIEGSFEDPALVAEALRGAEALFWLTPRQPGPTITTGPSSAQSRPLRPRRRRACIERSSSRARVRTAAQARGQ